MKKDLSNNTRSEDQIYSTVTPTFRCDPIPLSEIETPEIFAHLLPSPAREFAFELAVATEVSESMVTMSVLGVISSIAKRIFVKPKEGWFEPINIYSLIALPPGNNKSQVLRACLDPLIKYEREKIKSFEIINKQKSSQRKTQEKIIEGLRKKLHKSSNEERIKIMEEIEHLENNLPILEVAPRIFVNDVTPESLEKSAFEQEGYLAIFSDEGGFIETMSGLYTGGLSSIDILLKGIDGGDIRTRRMDRESMFNPFLTILLVVQPIIIQRMREKKAFFGKGLMERFLWVLPKSNLGYRTHNKPSVSKTILENYSLLVRELLSVAYDGDKGRKILALSDEALNQWKNFQLEIEPQLRPQGYLSLCQGWGGKIAGFVLRFAGLFQVIKNKGVGGGVIEKEIMIDAIKLGRLLIEHARAAYEMIEVDSFMLHVQECWEWISAQDSAQLKVGELTYAMRHRMNRDKIAKVLAELIERGLISELIRFQGKKTIIFYKNKINN